MALSMQSFAPRVAGGARRARAQQRRVVRAQAEALAVVPGAGVVAASHSRMPLEGKESYVFVSAEVSPWSKTGGLGDVLNGLPLQLAKNGNRVMTISPRYDQYADAWDTEFVVTIRHGPYAGETVRAFHAVKGNVDRVFVDHASFLSKVWGKTKGKLYGKKSGQDYSDNLGRFTMLSEAALEIVKHLHPGSPDVPVYGEQSVIVANDWHTALLPVLLKTVYQPRGEFLPTKVAMCVHNVAFQGRFFADSFASLGLPQESYKYFEIEDGYPITFDESIDEETSKALLVDAAVNKKKFKKINWLKAGFHYSDKNVTVSPNYAEEIVSGPDKGVELSDAIIAGGGIEGIVNGMDITEWNPATDKLLAKNYAPPTVIEGKAANKAALQEEAGLDVDPEIPLFGFIGRLEEQKGVDILMAAIPKVMAKYEGKAQFVILGTGAAKTEALVEQLETKYPGCAAGICKFSAPLAHVINAGADFILAPSRFEPCGLIQLHAMRYGSVPVVATTGGLVDTVKDGVTGIHCGAFNPDELTEADSDALAKGIMKGIALYDSKATFQKMVKTCINQDLSWEQPAKKWEALLSELKYPSQEVKAKKESVAIPVAKV